MHHTSVRNMYACESASRYVCAYGYRYEEVSMQVCLNVWVCKYVSMFIYGHGAMSVSKGWYVGLSLCNGIACTYVNVYGCVSICMYV